MTTYKIEILKAFLKNTELVKSMRECLHSLPDGEPNPYHLEGDVWTHTMMVYNSVMDDNPIDLIMALCHDIGKVLTRKVLDNRRVAFYGHAEASIQPSIDFVCFLYNYGIITSKILDDFIMFGLPAIANHAIYYQNVKKLHHFGNGYSEGIMYLSNLASMDVAGSISKNNKVDNMTVHDTLKYTDFNPDLPTIKIWVGLPGSGKDFLAKREEGTIISFDDLREEIYIDEVLGDVTMPRPLLYSKAFSYCNENKVDLMAYLKRKVMAAVKYGFNVIHICNTSLTRKARRTLVNTLGVKKFNFMISQVFVPSDVISSRNLNRESKYVPMDVINRMKEHMTVATHFEESFYRIEYILNDGDLK